MNSRPPGPFLLQPYQLIKFFRITTNFQAKVLELNSAGKALSTLILFLYEYVSFLSPFWPCVPTEMVFLSRKTELFENASPNWINLKKPFSCCSVGS